MSTLRIIDASYNRLTCLGSGFSALTALEVPQRDASTRAYKELLYTLPVCNRDGKLLPVKTYP
jgi:hypothetical protein